MTLNQEIARGTFVHPTEEFRVSRRKKLIVRMHKRSDDRLQSRDELQKNYQICSCNCSSRRSLSAKLSSAGKTIFLRD